MSPAFFLSFRAGVASELAMEDLVAVDASGFLRFSPVEVEICDEEDVEGFILNDPADRFIACGADVSLFSSLCSGRTHCKLTVMVGRSTES
jgi:hypothetical protein